MVCYGSRWRVVGGGGHGMWCVAAGTAFLNQVQKRQFLGAGGAPDLDTFCTRFKFHDVRTGAWVFKPGAFGI